MKEIEKILESLSPIERNILPFIGVKSVREILRKSGNDETTVMRALQFLENKKILRLKSGKKRIVDLGENGIIYLKNSLPERRLLNLLSEKPAVKMNEAIKAKLSENELKAALGALKKKAMIEVKEDRILLSANMEEVTRKMLEERFLELLPLELKDLSPEQLHAFKNLQHRRDIILIKDMTEREIELTELGKEIIKENLGSMKEMTEALTPEIIKNESWKGKKFRRYDITSKVPEIYGGKRHFVNQAVDYARKVWTELGFQEMSGNLIQNSFWNFDALFQPQDHPARDLQDTFYLKEKGKLPDKRIVNAVKLAHEKGVQGSKGWQYSWSEEEARKVCLRTHTTCLSAHTLYKLAQLKDKKDKQGKFFAIGKCFRNETIDWSHGFEFNQTEGIVVDKNANFKHLLGYLKEFFRKMGHEKIRFRPSYFPYTEPSVEIDVFHPEKKIWLELGGAGMFRPEVIIPLLGEYIPVLAWGPGFDRIIMDYYQIQDLREMYENDLTQLRKMKIWSK